MFGEGPTEVVAGYFKDTERKEFTQEDIRFTQKDGALYAVVLALPKGEVRIRSLGSSMALDQRKISSVQLLGGGWLDWKRTDDALVVQVPSNLPCSTAITLKVVYE